MISYTVHWTTPAIQNAMPVAENDQKTRSAPRLAMAFRTMKAAATKRKLSSDRSPNAERAKPRLPQCPTQKAINRTMENRISQRRDHCQSAWGGMPRASTHCSIFSGDGKVFRSRLKSSIGARVVTRRRSPGTREENEEERAPTVVPAGNAYFYYRRKSGEAAQNYGIRITISTET